MHCLHAAALWGRTEIVNLLLKQQNVEINQRDSDGKTALFYAAAHNHQATVRVSNTFNNLKVILIIYFITGTGAF